MAEDAVSFALESLTSLVVQEIKLLGSAKKEVEDIKSELEIIRSFLKDADSRAAQEEEEGGSNEGVNAWVKQVREEAYRIEDTIDEYLMKDANLRHGSGFIASLRKICCFIKKLKLRHGIASQIKEIKSSLDIIQQRRKRYGFRSIYKNGTTDVIPHDSRVSSLFVEDSDVVGIESTRDKLIGWLVNGSLERSVIAVVGEGGLGKTTLAGKIFNDDAVRKHFDCQAWITVGKEYNMKDLLRKIIQGLNKESVSKEMEKMEEVDLIATLREHLKDKIYMVVFDDVWKIEFWADIEHVLLDNKKYSRIMLTTRNRGVAEFCKKSSIVQVHLLQPLAQDEAWTLFCRKAFRFNTNDGCCPSELKELSENIIAKCGGLPLAIAAVGGLLSTKNTNISEWKNLLDDLGSKLIGDPHLKSCNKILLEGYYDLHHHLKSCFLYFGMFPEGYSIKCAKLICLWIAEGFVQHRKGPCEQVAEEYLNELINRNLVQVSERKSSGRVKSCRVHDLMHEVILRKTKELGFCQDLNGEDWTQRSQIRRISAHKNMNGFPQKIKDAKLRFILFSDVDNHPGTFLAALVADFKLLKVLSFESAPLEYLPEGVGKLFHLHYLSVRYTRVKMVPKSIGKLLNLETLDLRDSSVSELPIEIHNLKKLRYLLVHCWDYKFGCFGAAKIQEGIGSLADLRKLHYVQPNNSAVFIELKKLRQLRRLHIFLISRGDLKDLFASIENAKNLEKLLIKLRSEEEGLDLQSVCCPPQSLQSFVLFGNYIKKLPDWIFQLQNLIDIGLHFEGSIVDPLLVLQTLPNLVSLTLGGRDCDEQLHFKEGWFPNLKFLFLNNLKGLKLMMIDKGAMPNLRDWYFGPCPLMKEIPSGVEYLRNLKLLEFYCMLKEVKLMMEDENWEKITEHIPNILINYVRKHRIFNTKYLSSLSPQDFEQLLKAVEE